MRKTDVKTMLKTSEIAEIFGVTVRWVQQLTKDGVLTASKSEAGNQYDILPTVKRYIQYLNEKKTESSADEKNAEQRKLEAEARYKESKARVAELQLKELEGAMHRSDDVEAMTTDLVYAVRGMLLAFPGRLAMDLASIENPAEISVRIRKEVCEVLDELAAYQYDPDKYAKRVRERQGWDVIEDDDS